MDIKPELHGTCTYHGVPVEDVPASLIDGEAMVVLKSWNKFDGAAAAAKYAEHVKNVDWRLHGIMVICRHVFEENKFSAVPHQREFEMSVVGSIYERAGEGRMPTDAQYDLLKKFSNRKGSVSFAGKRGTFHFQDAS